MRVLSRCLALGAGLALLVAVAGTAPAQDKTAVVKDREALMKGQGKSLGVIKGYIEGKGSQAQAQTAAVALTQSIQKIPSVFPPGTDAPSPDGKYAPKPAIWSDQAGFLAAQKNAAGKADTLAAAVESGDKRAVQTAFADLGKNGCGGCHEKFRETLKK
jgi:cytochrome c556